MIPLQYRFYGKNRLKIYPKTCFGIPKTPPRVLKRELNTFKIIKESFENDYEPYGECSWWIADRNTLSNYQFLITSHCLKNDTVDIDLKDITFCTSCVLRLSIVVKDNQDHDGWYDSCIDFDFIE